MSNSPSVPLTLNGWTLQTALSMDTHLQLQVFYDWQKKVRYDPDANGVKDKFPRVGFGILSDWSFVYLSIVCEHRERTKRHMFGIGLNEVI
jgi:hypothetical protein